MKLTTLLVLAGVCMVQSYHLLQGNIADRVDLVNHTLVEYSAYPFMKRVKLYFYSSPDNRKIAGIQALDTLNSKATANITAGGVGYSYVNIRMKSERGRGLAYDVGIYASPMYI